MDKSVGIAVALGILGIGVASCGGKVGHRAGDGTDQEGGFGGASARESDAATAPVGVGGSSAPTTGSSTGGRLPSTADPTETGASNGPVISSVPGDVILSELTPEQATRVCEETSDAMDPNEASRQRLVCTVLGLVERSTNQAPTTAACEESVAACTAAATSAAGSPNCSGAAALLSGCNATVDEVNACLDALLALEQAYGTTLSCDTNSAAVLSMATLQAASCLVLQDKCPGFTGL